MHSGVAKKNKKLREWQKMFAIFSQIKSHSLQWIDKTWAKAANTTQQMLAEWMRPGYSGLHLFAFADKGR